MRTHCDSQGIDLPADFIPPEIRDGAQFYFDAFSRLVAERPLSLGFGAVHHGRIPFVAIERYAERIGIVDMDEFAMFDRIISAVDAKDVVTVNELANRKPDK